MVNWLPVFTQGNFTGQGQAAWNVTGNSDYVVFGGEFPRINNVGQQGLVRFARRSIAPKAQGPRFTNNQIVPTLVPTSPNSVRVSWEAGFDYDDQSLTYQVFRTGTAAARYTTTANSQLVEPAVARLRRHRPHAGHDVQLPDRGPRLRQPRRQRRHRERHDAGVGADQRLRQPGSRRRGTPVLAAERDRPGGADPGPRPGRVGDERAGNRRHRRPCRQRRGLAARPGPIPGDTAARLTATTSRAASIQLGTETAPDTFTAQAWIRTDTPSGRGGRILGFGDLQTGGSGHRDRHIYMNDAGQVTFGVKAQDGSLRTVSSGRSYNDNQWHQITATMSSAGMKLYVDGVRVGQRSDTTAGEAYLGYWRVGGDCMGWPNSPSTDNFIGDVDEVAIYPTALTQDQIIAQYEADRPHVADPAGARRRLRRRRVPGRARSLLALR